MPIIKRLSKDVILKGITDIMFDRYTGMKTVTEVNPESLLYLDSEKYIVLPVLNILSFLSAENTRSAPREVFDTRQYKNIAKALGSSIQISPFEIPFLRDGKAILFVGFDEDEEDKEAGVYVHRAVARLKDGIPNDKVRPVLRLPWELRFTLSVFPNERLSWNIIEQVFTIGGRLIGLGTFRGVFGKFEFAWK
jgi:hypothetical protein